MEIASRTMMAVVKDIDYLDENMQKRVDAVDEIHDLVENIREFISNGDKDKADKELDKMVRIVDDAKDGLVAVSNRIVHLCNGMDEAINEFEKAILNMK